MAPSRWQQRLNIVYLIFFVTHIPVMLIVDLASFYPASIRPNFTLTVRDYYIKNYRDRFFISPPLWFKGFIFLELVYHLPLSLWAVPALMRNDPMVPLHLLLFALEVAITTFASTLEMLSWDGYTSEEVGRLCALYVPYLGLALLMGTDMFMRVRSTVLAKDKSQ